MRHYLLTLVFLASILAACGDDDGVVAPMDSGTGGPDSGGGVDSGTGTDSGGGGMDAGGDDDAGPDPDAGGMTDAGVDASSPTAGAITFMEVCPPFTPCGGDLTGTWRYDGVCVTHAEVEAALTDACATATFISGTGSVDGTVSFDATTVMRDGTTSLSIVANIPAACTFSLPCATVVATQIETMAMVDSATCVDAAAPADGCDCTIMDSEVISESDPYTATGNVFENDSTMRRWEYCIDGTDLTLREIMGSDGDDPVEPGIQSLVSETP
jgi:hypothetical protein